MPRRKKSLIKVNKHTIFNIIGFITALIGILFILSFFNLLSSLPQQGRVLQTINETLVSKLGGLSILLPFLVILFSGHFFNTKKVEFVRLNITLGLVLIYVSLLGFFQAGEWGKLISSNLTLDFTIIGMIIILSVCFIIGLILVLDTSVESFLILVFSGIKYFFTFLRTQLFATRIDTFKMKNIQSKNEFILDNVVKEKQKVPLI